MSPAEAIRVASLVSGSCKSLRLSKQKLCIVYYINTQYPCRGVDFLSLPPILVWGLGMRLVYPLGQQMSNITSLWKWSHDIHCPPLLILRPHPPQEKESGSQDYTPSWTQIYYSSIGDVCLSVFQVWPAEFLLQITPSQVAHGHQTSRGGYWMRPLVRGGSFAT